FSFVSIPGWTRIAGPGTGIELQNPLLGTPEDGQQWLELASDNPTEIAQDVATVPGLQYVLSFAYSPRPGVANNPLNITWDGQVLVPGGLNSSGVGLSDTNWQIYTFPVNADPVLATTR